MDYTINLDDYNISYDLQYYTLMIKLLEPYITFKKSPTGFTINQKLEKSKFSIITWLDYIHFIQLKFPAIIDEELKILKNDLSNEETRKEAYSHHTRSYDRENIGREEDNFNHHYKLFKSMNKVELKKEHVFYKEKVPGSKFTGYTIIQNGFNQRIRFLERVSKMNETKNGSINDVNQFLENLKYCL